MGVFTSVFVFVSVQCFPVCQSFNVFIPGCQAVRGEDKVSSEPDLPSLIDFVLNDEIAAENVGINIGYVSLRKQKDCDHVNPPP